MKFDSNKAFPYPVLRPYSDDFIDSEFQATVDFEIPEAGHQARILLEYVISSAEIAQLVTADKAKYISIVSCRDTYFRKVCRSSKVSSTIALNVNKLRGEVRIESFVVVQEKIDDFTSLEINSEFGAGPFQYEPGDLLAQDEPQVFFIDRDMFKPVSSVFDLVKKDGLAEGEWSVGFDSDRIQIGLHQKTKEIIDNARNAEDNKIILINSIYFAVVMQAIYKLQTNRDDYRELVWGEVFLRQAHNIGIDIEIAEPHILAQKLMKTPLSLLTSRIFSGARK